MVGKIDDTVDTTENHPSLDAAVEGIFTAITARLVMSDEKKVMHGATKVLRITHVYRTLGSLETVKLLNTPAVEWVWFQSQGILGLYASVSSIPEYPAIDPSPAAYEARLGGVVRAYKSQNPGQLRIPLFHFSGDLVLKPAVLTGSAPPGKLSKRFSEGASEKQQTSMRPSSGQYMSVKTYLSGATVNGKIIPPERHAEFLAHLKRGYNIVPVAMEEKGAADYFRMEDVLRLEKEGISPPQIDARAILALERKVTE
ncbi:hypothetical protein HYS47_04255 [Candidatus Woesearchaeota archaeon]|nr:hypothetical protein [Candidatus Woesearchaeota archaeon]